VTEEKIMINETLVRQKNIKKKILNGAWKGGSQIGLTALGGGAGHSAEGLGFGGCFILQHKSIDKL
jgi:hypothetical protein